MEEPLGLAMWSLIKSFLKKIINEIETINTNAADSTQYYPIQAGSR